MPRKGTEEARKRIIGWSDEPLDAEQKLDNLFFTVENALHAISNGYRKGAPASRLMNLAQLVGPPRFSWRDGYSFRFKIGTGYFNVYAHRVGSDGDERNQYPAWDEVQSVYDSIPPGLMRRKVPSLSPTVHRILNDIDRLQGQSMNPFRHLR